VRALKEKTVFPDGIELDFVIMDSRERHWRMARENEFDICELNASAYFMARNRGKPYTAIPVFLHRRFRHGFVFINTAAGIEEPKDLIGKRVGSTNFQPAGNIWIRGMLEDEFCVPHDSMTWFTDRDEDIEFTPHDGLHIERIGGDKSFDGMLVDGEIDAIISPNVPAPFEAGDPKIARLFPDYAEREVAYYRRTGIFPIMHVTTVKDDVLRDHPWVAQSLVRAFEEAKQTAYARLENPRIVPLAFYRTAWEDQRALLGPDPWEYGLGPRNRENLETMIRYVHTQGLTDRAMPIEETFVS